jgi:LPS sulfotransferase NodH
MEEVDSARRLEYFLCGSQRSGSNLLCEVLLRSGVAGRPTEHFVPAFPEAEVLGHGHAGFEESVWARTRDLDSFPEFFSAVISEGSSPNGVFGTKLMWNALGGFLEKLAELPGCRELEPVARLTVAFAHPRFIHLHRRNRVRQAVSWALAAQTGHYSSQEAAIRAPLAEPAFDLQLLDGLLRLIREADEGWDSFFVESGIEPLRLWYEDLVPNLQSAVVGILAWLGIAAPERIDLGGLRHQPQATALNAEWERRFRELRPYA